VRAGEPELRRARARRIGAWYLVLLLRRE
jgi:hypothetical protein